MKEVKNFCETEMNCIATVVDWAELNKINAEATDFLLYFGNYFDDNSDGTVWALFGFSGGKRYCVKLHK